MDFACLSALGLRCALQRRLAASPNVCGKLAIAAHVPAATVTQAISYAEANLLRCSKFSRVPAVGVAA
jgi:hypothetical protein